MSSPRDSCTGRTRRCGRCEAWPGVTSMAPAGAPCDGPLSHGRLGGQRVMCSYTCGPDSSRRLTDRPSRPVGRLPARPVVVGTCPALGDKKRERVAPPHHPKKLVGETGFEPATSCSRSRRATKLRYSPTSILSIGVGESGVKAPCVKAAGSMASWQIAGGSASPLTWVGRRRQASGRPWTLSPGFHRGHGELSPLRLRTLAGRARMTHRVLR